MKKTYIFISLLCALTFFNCKNQSKKDTKATQTTQKTKLKVLNLPMTTSGPKTLDPIRGSTTYESIANSQVYETLLQYKYLKRPFELEPLLLSEMPIISKDYLHWKFKLKKNVYFHDDPCFKNGKGRKITSSDVFYSWKRMANNNNQPKSWWLFKNTIVGFDDYKETQNNRVKNGKQFDYDADIEGFRIIDEHNFEVILKKPVRRFIWILAMFQTSIVPREAVEKYGKLFGRHPVGTGPFTLKEKDWINSKEMTFYKNPNYHESYYPNEYMPEDEKQGLHLAKGKKLPLVDKIKITMFVETQPMWLEFQNGKLDYTGVPYEYMNEAFHKRTRKLKKSFKKKGITFESIESLDFIFRGFNMEDKTLGGYTEKQKSLRKAISLAMDWDELNNTFYDGINKIYDGPIPPGLDGYPKDGKAPKNYRGPNIKLAREHLKKAGYPDGNGLKPIDYYTSRGGTSNEQAEMLIRQLEKIGIKIKKNLVDFSTLMDAVNNKKAPFFSFAWNSDYPDAENNLALFYSPNKAPGSNHYNYKNPLYDKLYKKILSMEPSLERTKIYKQMRDILIEDVPFLGSMARTNFYLINPWLKNFKPAGSFSNWYKYLDIDSSKR